MNRQARTGLSLLALALAGVAALGLTGVVRIPWLSPAPTKGVDADRPDELAASDAGPGRELAASGGRPKTAKPGEPVEAPAEPALPSEATGTAIGKVGGSIRGRVVETEAKHPVAGATVELLMPEALFHYLKASPIGRFDRLTVMTDGEGRFTLNSVLPSADYALRVRKGTGPYATKRDLALSAREVFDVGDIVMGPSGGLSGHVMGADGKGIADARIAITWKIQNDFDAVMADPDTLPWVEATLKTDVDGAWNAEGLEPGDKSLIVKAPSGAADVKASVAVVAGVVTPGIDWTLGGSLAIAGRVEWADGKPIEAARVFAKTMKMPASFTVESGADGSFRLAGLADGIYFVGAFIPGMSAQVVPGRKAGDENVRITVPLAGALSGRVVSRSTGRPIPQFKLTPTFAEEQGWMQKMVGQKFDKILGGAGFQSSEGTFRFDRLKAGHYILHVESEGYPSTDSPPVEVIAGAESKSGDVALPDGNRVSGFVRDAADRPIADATIVILNFNDFDFVDQTLSDDDKVSWVSEMPEETRTDEKGAFTTSPLTPRAYEIGARAKGHLSRVLNIDVTGKPVEGAEFRLDPSAAVRLHVGDARGAPVVTYLCLVEATGVISVYRSDSAGLFDRPNLKPGRWAAAEWREDLMRNYNLARRAKGEYDGAAFFERFRASPGVIEFSVAAGELVERSITVLKRVRIEGKVRLGARKLRGRWFFLQAERDEDDKNWISVDDDGAFDDDSVRVGRYRVFRPPEEGATTDAPVEVDSLDVPDAGLKGIVIDLSK